MNLIQRHLVLTAMCMQALTAGAATVYVSTTGNDSTGGGTSAAPYKTVTMAVSKASAGSTISIASGEYHEPGTVSISNSLTLQGPGAVQSPPANAESSPATVQALPNKPGLGVLCRYQPCITTAAADRVFEVTGAATNAVAFSNLAVLGPDRSASVGSSSFGMVVDGVGVRLNNVTILAGTGGAGSKGSDGGSGDGASADNPLGGKGGYCEVPPASLPCACFTGGEGTSPSNFGGVKGGSGASVRAVNCPSFGVWDSSDLPSGWGGGPGDPGPAGPGGDQSGSATFSFATTAGRIDMKPGVSGQGVIGVPGAGGGGGGVGGTRYVGYVLCKDTYAMGGRGGTGGTGGAAGLAGQGGAQGGGAFGLVVARATVTGSALNVYGGTGGIGGVGGQGGGGLPGLDGATGDYGYNAGAQPNCATQIKNGGQGGQGGTGGHGGAGGGGAGGNGGPSIDIVLLGKDALLAGSLRVATLGGRGGSGNVGGKAGAAGTVASSGQPGIQQTQGTYPAP